LLAAGVRRLRDAAAGVVVAALAAAGGAPAAGTGLVSLSAVGALGLLAEVEDRRRFGLAAALLVAAGADRARDAPLV
jgi:hypothetical protein